MRLTAQEIQYICRKVVKTLSTSGKIQADSLERLVEALVHVVTDEMQVEERLNEEVRRVLEEHTGEMQRSNITYAEMFKMVKKKLAREKGVIL